jgi:hypothetical protein
MGTHDTSRRRAHGRPLLCAVARGRRRNLRQRRPRRPAARAQDPRVERGILGRRPSARADTRPGRRRSTRTSHARTHATSRSRRRDMSRKAPSRRVRPDRHAKAPPERPSRSRRRRAGRSLSPGRARRNPIRAYSRRPWLHRRRSRCRLRRGCLPGRRCVLRRRRGPPPGGGRGECLSPTPPLPPTKESRGRATAAAVADRGLCSTIRG